MIVFPAIDIKGGKVVRLAQGKFEYVTQYSEDPVTMAQKWASLGAQWLHVVDLDGAQTGEMKNFSIIAKIVKSVKIPVQVGGGIRKESLIDDLIQSAKVRRIVLGTKAVEDPAFLRNVIAKHHDQIAVSLDCSNGFVTDRGWTAKTTIKATDLVKELQQLGLRCLIYTDIARDGMLSGPNYPGIEEMLAVAHIPLIASGGIASLDDIHKLKALTSKGLIGAITGKAIYEGKLDFKEAVRICSTNA
jgi:phosphoribosylformimino-5-aminoimidazole carboxamide ribotide isomerase